MQAAELGTSHAAGGLRRIEVEQPASAGAVIDLRERLIPKSAGRLKLPALTEWRFVQVFTDRIAKGVRQAIAGGRRCDPAPGFHWSFPLREIGDRDTLRGVVGLPSACDPELLKALANPAMLVQSEMVLSARVYQQCRFDGLRARLSVSSILDDRGIQRRKSGEHKPERLQEQRVALRFLTSLKVVADYWTQEDGRKRTLDGLLWRVPEDDRAALWSPGSAVFTVRRGDPFFRMGWSVRNDFAKPVGAGLLQLRQKAAVLLGAFLATVGPMNGYRAKPFDEVTLLTEAGLADTYTKNPKERRRLLEEALDALKAAEVIGTWRYRDGGQVLIGWPQGIKGDHARKAKGRCRRA